MRTDSDTVRGDDRSLAELLAEHTDMTAEEIERGSEEIDLPPLSEWTVAEEQ